jgi:hypothetical protein
MNKDGDLRPLFRHQFRTWQWSSIETAGTASGVPDSEFCTPTGCQGWVEFKKTHIFHVHIKPLQVAWLMRRCRYGGNAWIAVRRLPSAQKFMGDDELWLMRGNQAEALCYHGLSGTFAKKWSGGPSGWNYEEVADILTLKDRFWEEL